MKIKTIILSVAVLCISSSVHCQTISDAEMDQLMSNCQLILKLHQENNESRSRITATQKEIQIAHQTWKQICESYMESGDQCAEDFSFLIQHTDSIEEAELYEQLVEASKHLKTGGEPYRPAVTEETDKDEKGTNGVTDPVPTEEKTKIIKDSENIKAKINKRRK